MSLWYRLQHWALGFKPTPEGLLILMLWEAVAALVLAFLIGIWTGRVW